MISLSSIQVHPKPSTLTAIMVLILSLQHFSFAQDILRQPTPQTAQQSPPPSSSSSPSFTESQLANIQLPPQIAQLSPQQLHQLAQIRELQIQAQQRQAIAAREAAASHASQSGQQESAINAPLPLGLEQSVPPNDVRQPTSNSYQQPRPLFEPAATSAPSSPSSANESGAYNEADSELEGVDQQSNSSSARNALAAHSTVSATQSAANNAQSSQASAGSQPQSSSQQPPPSFEVNWNKCPQLDPSDAEKAKKTQVITKCLQMAPIPQNLTRENVENHREQIASCALKIEGWFDEFGNYKYDKAETEIKSKKLEPSIETQVLKFHVACKDEANKKFPRPQEKLIDQVQFYQACMDYYISIVCEIEVSVDQ